MTVPMKATTARDYQQPRELSKAEIQEMVQAFQDAVKRAVDAGFDAIELHAAHGYLIHQFYSAKTNQRQDEYGQDKMLFGEHMIRAAKSRNACGYAIAGAYFCAGI
jgi:2,4-dienoyl-CoA reductase-like NADH-dependent reductase (Old Yellow Enzyme family)